MSDMEAVTQAATDYIESWLDGDNDRMAACLHPALAKRRVKDPASDDGELLEVAFSDMTGLAGPQDGVARDYEVTVLDVSAATASVKVTSAPFIDHLQLAQVGDRWLIVNVLYERRPPSA
jgi:Putative lumazine-binding